jgi:UDP-N-acetylglucosamine 1-carboxyvinyltransferase
MSKFIIHGGKKLSGEIEVRGAKNEATKLVAASVLTDQDVVISNAPRILDLEKMLEIIRSMGGRAEWIDGHSVILNCKNIDPQKMDQKLARQLRASIVFIGPLLARFGKLDFPTPGGCIIGNRPMDIHFSAFEKMGAKIEEDRENNSYKFSTNKLQATKILTEFSVTATENVILASVLTSGKTQIKTAALEPHTENLIRCLNKMGAKISGLGTHTLEIEGVEKLHGAEHTVIPDMIEAGTFVILGAVTRSEIKIKNINLEHLDLFFD